MQFDEEELLLQSAKFNDKGDSQKQFDASKIKYFLIFYALPLFSVLLFLGIIVYGVIPEIHKIFDVVEEVDALKIQDTNLQIRVDKLIALKNDTTSEQDLIDMINELIPTGKSEVVKFRNRVAKTATLERLDFQNATTGETVLNSSEDNIVAEGNGFSLIQIPSEFDTTGLFLDLRSFLYELYNINDFFVVNEMELNSAPVEDIENWSGGFVLTKYQFFADENFNPEATFLKVSELTTPNPLVVEFLQKNYSN